MYCLTDFPSPTELSTLKRENDSRIEDCCKELEVLLDGTGGRNGNDFGSAKRCINRLRYWMSIDEEIKKML